MKINAYANVSNLINLVYIYIEAPAKPTPTSYYDLFTLLSSNATAACWYASQVRTAYHPFSSFSGSACAISLPMTLRKSTDLVSNHSPWWVRKERKKFTTGVHDDNIRLTLRVHSDLHTYDNVFNAWGPSIFEACVLGVNFRPWSASFCAVGGVLDDEWWVGGIFWTNAFSYQTHVTSTRPTWEWIWYEAE